MHTESAKKGFIFNTKWAFSSAAVFTLTVVSLSQVGLVPEAPKTQASEEPIAEPAPFIEDAVPTKLKIDAIGVNATILNPESTAIAELDKALLGGAVRYPGSADLAGEGTMLIFGHSTSHAVVMNQNFKLFNDLSKVNAGDLVRVQSGSTENVYRVTSIRHAPASEVDVQISGTGKRLVISTCDSFGSKSDRIVVEAAFVGSFPLEAAL